MAEAKERTKEELKKNFNSLLEGENYRDNKIWDIAFELSAPQILIPEHFIDKDAMIMVVDFGKLTLLPLSLFGTAFLLFSHDGDIVCSVPF